MGYHRRCSSEIRINPPLRWEEFREAKVWTRNEYREGQLNVTVKTSDTPTGELREIAADRIVANPLCSGGDMSLRDLEPDIQAIVDTWPEREYTGFILCEWEDGEPSRLYVKDGKVTEVKAVLTWPEV